MSDGDQSRHAVRLADTPALWPSPDYDRQVERLRGAVGERVYLVEARVDDLHLSARFSGRSYELLDVIDFPRPDPVRRLYPHLLLLDDGRGINLGRLLRVSLERPYAPAPEFRLFEDRALLARTLAGQRRLSAAQIRRTARRQLAAFARAPRRRPPELTLTDDD